MTFGAEIWGPPLIQAAGNIAGGMLGNSNPETRIQKRQRHLIDDLLKSLDGNGKYSSIFENDETAFNKSFKEPALSKFRNQTAPQIQQQYIASGQQRGTALDDQLLRAGVDMDSLLNQYMFDFQQKGIDRKQNAMNQILGVGAGSANPVSSGQAAAQNFGGFLNSDSFANLSNDLFKKDTPAVNSPQPPRQGFVPERRPLPQFNPSLKAGY